MKLAEKSSLVLLTWKMSKLLAMTREEKKLSLDYAAKRLGITPDALLKIERCEVESLTSRFLSLMAWFYDIDPDALNIPARKKPEVKTGIETKAVESVEDDSDHFAEEWKPIPQWENLYEASNYGRVKKLAHIDPIGRYRSERIITASVQGNCVSVRLRDGDKIVSVPVARLVAQTFIPGYNGRGHIKRKDGNMKNVRLSNLDIAT